MSEWQMSVQEIKTLMEAFAQTGLGEFKLKQGDFCLQFGGRKVEQVMVAAAADTQTVAVVAEEPAPVEAKGHVVVSPIVGTFYASPAPDKPPYVTVGSEVHKGDVLFIIESMKLMNEVASEMDGVVKEILVDDAQGVEYGQPILVIG